jgi:hypothetical protein
MTRREKYFGKMDKKCGALAIGDDPRCLESDRKFMSITVMRIDINDSIC